ncbi:hypothetical protein [uncultured Shimia sp.]|uniref:hypothetical protein n=1 Tax=uncultured Shimia sp. TaxID=573152 RepID=UPI00262A3D21|nr:hypothetical protein [uncultured Shimia sp.]
MSKSHFHHDQADALASAGKLHSWPDEIELPVDPETAGRAQKVFDKVQTNRAHGDWAEGDLLEVARYARLVSDVEAVYIQLQQQGWTVMGGRNGTTPVANPLATIHSNLQATLGAIARRLNLAAGYQPAKSKDRGPQDARARTEREAREVLKGKDAPEGPRLLA